MKIGLRGAHKYKLTTKNFDVKPTPSECKYISIVTFLRFGLPVSALE